MTLGSPTSPKPASGAQFLPGFLMGDLPAPSTPQPRPFSLASPLVESTGTPRGQQVDARLPTNWSLLMLEIYLYVCPLLHFSIRRRRRLCPAARCPHPKG